MKWAIWDMKFIIFLTHTMLFNFSLDSRAFHWYEWRTSSTFKDPSCNSCSKSFKWNNNILFWKLFWKFLFEIFFDKNDKAITFTSNDFWSISCQISTWSRVFSLVFNFSICSFRCLHFKSINFWILYNSFEKEISCQLW